MDRVTTWAGAIPTDLDIMRNGKYAMVGIAKLAAAMLGTATVVNGLACVPTGPAGLTVNVNPGEIYSLANIDTAAQSSLAADTHQILKSGILMDAVNLSCPPPGTGGQSINYLIQATYQDQDADLTALPYYNASNPTQAWSGPNNSGTAQATTRKGIVVLSAKAGVAATTGSQTTPAADSGYTGLWVVTVANGQTTITSANITQAANAPILPNDLLHAMQQSGAIVGVDTGAANAYAVSYNPAITALADGMVLWFKVKTANTGASTLNVNGLGASAVVGGAHSALQGGELVVGGRAQVVWRADISSWVLIECTGAALQVAPATASQHAVQLGQIGHGQCRLSVASGTQVKLSPYNGANLFINGVPQLIPGAGVTISNAGLAASTLYYVYAFMNAGAMALELSATGHATGTNGVEQKTGDATRTLVGMVRTNASSQFIDSPTQRFCLNWFSRRAISAVSVFAANRSTTSATPVELSSTERAEFLSWGDESAFLSFSASASQNTSAGSFSSAVALDTTSFGVMVVNVSASGIPQNVSSMAGVTPTEGYHYATAYGAATSGFTATWLGQYPTLTALIRG